MFLIIYFQETTNYDDIPRYGLKKEDIRRECESVFQHYPGTPYTKLIRVFFEKLFKAELCAYCSAVGTMKKTEGSEARPGLCEFKKQAIYRITGMAGFTQSYSQFNVAMNNVLKYERKQFNIPEKYDGRYKARIARYNDDEEAKAKQREKEYNDSRYAGR